MTDKQLIVLHPCPATTQYQSWSEISQPAVALNEILYSSIPLLIQPGISLAVWMCGIWSRWAALLRMLTDIPFHLRPRPALSSVGLSLTWTELQKTRWRCHNISAAHLCFYYIQYMFDVRARTNCIDLIMIYEGGKMLLAIGLFMASGAVQGYDLEHTFRPRLTCFPTH